MIQWPIQPKNKKYEKWYVKLITSAQLRTLGVDVYYESHHIIPRSFGGSNHRSNLAKLTAREHYIAHALLWKMQFPGTYGSKMAFAFNTFMNKMQKNNPVNFNAHNHNYKINSRIYESFRIQYALMLSEKMKGTGNHFYGKTHSEETRRVIGEKSKLKEFKRGPEHPNWGKPSAVSPEGKVRQVSAIKQRWADPEFRQRMIEKRKIFLQTPRGIEQRKKFAEFNKTRVKTPEEIEKTAAAKRGKTWEELYTPTQIERMRLAFKNRTLSPEARARMAEATRKIGQRPKSEEHKRKISESNKGKHSGLVGEKNPRFGKKMSEEQKEKLRLANLNRYHKRLSQKFVGPLRPETVIEFRGVFYKTAGAAAKAHGLTIGKIRLQIKYWGANPDNDTIQKIDSGELKYPRTAPNKGISMTNEQKKLISQTKQKRMQTLRDAGIPLPNTGRKNSKESKQRMSIAAKNRTLRKELQ